VVGGASIANRSRYVSGSVLGVSIVLVGACGPSAEQMQRQIEAGNMKFTSDRCFTDKQGVDCVGLGDDHLHLTYASSEPSWDPPVDRAAAERAYRFGCKLGDDASGILYDEGDEHPEWSSAGFGVGMCCARLVEMHLFKDPDDRQALELRAARFHSVVRSDDEVKQWLAKEAQGWAEARAEQRRKDEDAAERDRREHERDVEARRLADREDRLQTARAVAGAVLQLTDTIARGVAPATTSGAGAGTPSATGGTAAATSHACTGARPSDDGESCTSYCDCRSSQWTDNNVIRNGCAGGICGAKNGAPCGPRAGAGGRSVACIPGQGTCQGYGNSTADRARYLAETGTGRCEYGVFQDAPPSTR